MTPFVIPDARGGFAQVPFATALLKSKLNLFAVCVAYLTWVSMLAAWFGSGKRIRTQIALISVVLVMAGLFAGIFGEGLPDVVWWLFFTHSITDFIQPAGEDAFSFSNAMITLLSAFALFTLLAAWREASLVRK